MVSTGVKTHVSPRVTGPPPSMGRMLRRVSQHPATAARPARGEHGGDAGPQSEVVTWRFDGAQAQRRAEARRAARELAAAGSYSTVTMAAVAKRIGTTRSTLYRYFSSKDQLLAEVARDWAQEVNEEFRRHRPSAANLSERVVNAFDRLIELATANPGLTSAILLAATSSDPAVPATLRSWPSTMDLYLETLAGEEQVENLDDIGMVLGHVLRSVLVGVVLTGQDRAEAMHVLRTAVDLLLPS
jgi:AcrR family transcriptional regulator